MAEETVVADPAQPAPAESAQATEGGEGGGEPQAAAQPDFGAIQQQIENMSRELGQFRKAQSMLDRLPNMIDDRLTKWQKAQQLNSLPPEQQAQQRQYEEQEAALAKFARERAREEFRELSKDYLPVIENMQKREQQQAFYAEFQELAGEQAQELEEAAKSVFSQINKDLDSGNEIKVEAALKFMERAKVGGPEFVIFHAQRELAKQQKANADGVVQSRVQNGKLAAQQPKGKGQASGAKKSMAAMSTPELEALMTEIGPVEYDKRLKAEMSVAGK